MKKLLIFIALACNLICICAQEENNKTIAYIFSHGLQRNGSQSKKYLSISLRNSSTWLIQKPLVTFNYPDAYNGKNFDPSKTSFAQKNEILAIKKAYQKGIQLADGVVLMGMSRGAATILTFAGTEKPEQVQAIVVESPFDSIKNTLNTKLKNERISWIPSFIVETAPSLIFSTYNRNGIAPIDVVEEIDHQIPILIVCSKKDSIIPAQNSFNLYKKLIQAGHPHAYILILDEGDHGDLLSGPQGTMYLSVVHAFYKKYNLFYDPDFAAMGENLLNTCQPEI